MNAHRLETTPALSVVSVSRRFGPTLALDEVELSFAPGRVTAVVGANGSGKSTLLRILAGLLAPSAGRVLAFGSHEVRSVHSALDAGVVLVPQEPTLAGHLTVWQNVSLVSPARRTGFLLNDRKARRFAARHVAGLLPADVLDRPTGSLNKSTRQLVQLAAAMARDPQVLLLDEPTAVLDEDGVVALHALVRSFRERGGTVLIVSHRLKDVLELADDVVALRNGRVQLDCAVTPQTEREIVALLSAESRVDRDHRAPADAPAVLRATGLKGWRGLDVPELVVRAGEIVGVAGQSGSGRSRLAAALAGSHPAHGTVTVAGTSVRTGSIRSARAAGIAYVPEDRHAAAIMGNQSVEANLLLGQGDSTLRTGPFRSRRGERRVGRSLVASYDIRPPLPDKQAGLLSGGNQQKVAVARALAGRPRVVIADEPTQGVDAAARSAIHDALVASAEEGTAVLVVCSEFEELFALADRIVVLYDGRVVLDRHCSATTPDEVLAASLGATAPAAVPPTDPTDNLEEVLA
ncbi:sugar ABC transporter ATP-binding protein [Nocardioides nitrophenolicus]|uniref:sugar ABC transporter ATP-binding protein n=1 Tax=Nocardioides nitrophenolicus TaxID=60489 RepID=UPI0019601566|nr:sugar ABC transporter ATP-binding protein [Nocardioides nitrophenolicus]MBM7520435.1 ABC-type sugar transport system ATPase subunit [Nocardioides nitrophenolicus]